jgi:heterotetrameric sarcosine oxidase gamma subunit
VSTWAAPVKLSPLHATARDLGAGFAKTSGWQIPEVYSTLEAEISAAERGVALADETANGKIRVEGEEAEAVWGPREVEIGGRVVVDSLHAYRLRSDCFFVSTPPGRDIPARRTLMDRASDRFVTVTNLTHAWSEIRVVGSAASTLMSRVCGLDFEGGAFPDGVAKQTSVARTTQLVIRRDAVDLPAYSILGARSLASYLWDIFMEAGTDLQVAPIGLAAIGALESR